MADKGRPEKYGRNKRASRKRKRKYYGNQKLEEVEVETELVPVELDQPLDEVMQEEYTTTPMSASAKKLKAFDVPVSIEPVECNVVD